MKAAPPLDCPCIGETGSFVLVSEEEPVEAGFGFSVLEANALFAALNMLVNMETELLLPSGVAETAPEDDDDDDDRPTDGTLTF